MSRIPFTLSFLFHGALLHPNHIFSKFLNAIRNFRGLQSQQVDVGLDYIPCFLHAIVRQSDHAGATLLFVVTSFVCRVFVLFHGVATVGDPDRFKRLLTHPENLDEDVLHTMWLRFHSMALSAILTNNSDLANDAYARALQVPRTQTLLDLRGFGIVMGTWQRGGAEFLHICFKGTVPMVVKVIDEVEMKRTQRFIETAGLEPDGVATSDHIHHVVTCSLLHAHSRNLTIMPLLPATLAHIVRLNIEGAAKLLDQMIEALQFIHDQGFAHMDVKPSNICINGKGDFILADLGSMAPFGECTKSTVPFLPQDLQRPWMISDAMVDFWMLAMTLGERLCGWERGTGAREPTRAVLRQKLMADRDAESVIGKLLGHLK